MVTNCDHLARLKFSKSTPYAFTDHSEIMVATVLNSPEAMEMNVFIVRAFVRMREHLSRRIMITFPEPPHLVGGE